MSAAHMIEMNLIKRVVEEKGLKQIWLSEKLGKSYAIVNAYVQNHKQPHLKVLYEIASILKIDPKDLINSNIK
jgi:putative transcriptional regulator